MNVLCLLALAFIMDASSVFLSSFFLLAGWGALLLLRCWLFIKQERIQVESTEKHKICVLSSGQRRLLSCPIFLKSSIYAIDWFPQEKS